MKKLNYLAIALGLLTMSQAHAEFGVLGGMSSFAPSGSGTIPALGADTFNNKASSTLAAGVYYARQLAPMMKLEIDGLYVTRKNELTDSQNLIDSIYESKVIQIPVLLRFNLIPTGLINIGVGGYYEVAMSGGIDVTDVKANTAKTNSSYGNQNLKHNDYGAVGSIQIRLPLAPMLKFLIDGRYVYGVSEQFNDITDGGNFTTSTMKNRYMQVLGGFAFAM